jgi:hypothetical protein
MVDVAPIEVLAASDVVELVPKDAIALAGDQVKEQLSEGQ